MCVEVRLFARVSIEFIIQVHLLRLTYLGEASPCSYNLRTLRDWWQPRGLRSRGVACLALEVRLHNAIRASPENRISAA